MVILRNILKNVVAVILTKWCGKAVRSHSRNRKQWGSLFWINEYTCWLSASIHWNNYCTLSHQQASNHQSKPQVTDYVLKCSPPSSYDLRSLCKILDLSKFLNIRYAINWGTKLFIYRFLSVWMAQVKRCA